MYVTYRSVWIQFCFFQTEMASKLRWHGFHRVVMWPTTDSPGIENDWFALVKGFRSVPEKELCFSTKQAGCVCVCVSVINPLSQNIRRGLGNLRQCCQSAVIQRCCGRLHPLISTAASHCALTCIYFQRIQTMVMVFRWMSSETSTLFSSKECLNATLTTFITSKWDQDIKGVEREQRVGDWWPLSVKCSME